MIDTKARKYIDKPVNKLIKILARTKLTPIQITIVALILGIASASFYYFNQALIALLCLWLSGLCDVIDGALARYTKRQSAFGTVLDILCDRMVECSIILVIALKHPELSLALIILVMVILFSMTVFLAVGAAAKNDGLKSFKYQTGLGERTEGFILLSLMILLPKYLVFATIVFVVIVVITIIQRLIEAYQILK